VLAVDTNVLYAADADSQFRTACRNWLERQRARPGAWYQLVDPSAHDKPRAAIRRPARGEAWNFVAALLASPGLAVLVPTERLADIAEALTWSRKLGGTSAPSAQFCHDISGWLWALL
jgi:hypothetical protein